MKRALLAGLLLAACKGGLFTDKGNAFPCDFNLPEGDRDAVCSMGDVCGVDNLCRRFHYEGPQFELGAVEPTFDAGLVLHPGLLNRPISIVTNRPDLTGGNHVTAVMGSGTMGRLAVVDVGPDTTVRVTDFATSVESVSAVATPVLFATQTPWAVTVVREGLLDRTSVIAGDTGLVTQVAPGPGNAVLQGDRLRSGIDVAVLLRLGQGPTSSSAGAVQQSGAYTPLTFVDGGSVEAVEARFLPGSNELLVLTGDGFLLRRLTPSPDFRAVSNPAETFPASLTQPGVRAELRSDTTGTVWAFTRSGPSGRATALSSWRLDRGATPTIVRLWSDCTPCRKGRIAAFTPTLDAAPGIEVLCALPTDGTDESRGTTHALVKVTGSAAADESQDCIVDPLEAPFALGEINTFARGRRALENDAGREVVYDDATGAGIVLGGRHGQLWGGASFSSVLPLFLDRTPVAFGTLRGADGGTVPAAITDRYVATPRGAGLGFQVIDAARAASVPVPEGTVVSALVGQAPGWGVLSTGDLAFLTPAQNGMRPALTFGPRLVDARGAPSRGPFFAEALVQRDGGLGAFVLTGDDSVYFETSPAQTTASLNALAPLAPQLTPLASSPIRSFALERSAVATAPPNQVRGYLIAGRSLFVVTLSGTPPRWTATSVVLQGGEPVETWMDNPFGGLGRVGYRDGQVFTLPGGFLLVNELPRVDGQMPAQVTDYENLAGWPVAMTSNGLFAAYYRVGEDGALQNRFEDGGVGKAMSWTEVTLPDGSRPWLGKAARLQVLQTGTETREGAAGTTPYTVRVFSLLVYTDDQVIEVGRHIRR